MSISILVLIVFFVMQFIGLMDILTVAAVMGVREGERARLSAACWLFFYESNQCQAPTDTNVEQIMLEILINNFSNKKTKRDANRNSQNKTNQRNR